MPTKFLLILCGLGMTILGGILIGILGLGTTAVGTWVQGNSIILFVIGATSSLRWTPLSRHGEGPG